jgi:RNA polymerase sigma-B factor
LAEHLGIGPDEVVEALEASSAYRIASLDRPVGAEEDRAPMIELIGNQDPGYERVVDRQVLRDLITELDLRDKRILLLRFFRGMTQAEIGEQLGVTQMQVSRLIARLLAHLRAGFA